MSSILVTGSTGFIGRPLLQQLVASGFSVKAAYRNKEPKLVEHSKLLRLLKVGEINADTDWASALEDVDIVVHLAARAHVILEQDSNPRDAFMSINAEGTRNLAEQAIAAGVKRFVFISSIGAMATLSESILTEESECKPTTDYGESKLLAEQYILQACEGSNMTWTILRPTLVYGPGNPGNMKRLLKLISKELPLPLGAIQNQRSFLFVGNLIDAIICSMQHSNAANELFLISDGTDLSTSALIEKLAFYLGQEVLLLPVPCKLMLGLASLIGRSETVERLVKSLAVDSQKIRDRLSWDPPFSLEQGLEQTSKHFMI